MKEGEANPEEGVKEGENQQTLGCSAERGVARGWTKPL